MSAVEVENVVAEEVKVSSLDELFTERNLPKSDEDLKEGPIKAIEKEKIEPKTSKIDKNIDNKDDLKENSKKDENKAADKKVIESKDVDEDERDIEVGKLRKALNDSQKWGHTNSKRLKSVVKIIGSLKEQGILNEDEFTNLNSLLSSDSEEPDVEIEKTNANPLDRFINSATKRVDDLREFYEDDVLFDKKLDAFNFFMKHSSEKEQDDLLEELESYDPNSLKLAKRLFKIGEKYYEENYRELDEAGGLKELVTVKNTEIKKMQRKIDKLERELLQYNDYDPSTMKIDELGDTPMENLSTDKPGDVLGSLIKERDHKKR